MFMEYEGIVGMILFIGLFYRILSKMAGNHHADKHVTTTYMVISAIFLVQVLLFMPSLNSLPIYYLFFVCSAFLVEEKKKVSVIKSNITEEIKNEIK